MQEHFVDVCVLSALKYNCRLLTNCLVYIGRYGFVLACPNVKVFVTQLNVPTREKSSGIGTNTENLHEQLLCSQLTCS